MQMAKFCNPNTHSRGAKIRAAQEASRRAPHSAEWDGCAICPKTGKTFHMGGKMLQPGNASHILQHRLEGLWGICVDALVPLVYSKHLAPPSVFHFPACFVASWAMGIP